MQIIKFIEIAPKKHIFACSLTDLSIGSHANDK